MKQGSWLAGWREEYVDRAKQGLKKKMDLE